MNIITQERRTMMFARRNAACRLFSPSSAALICLLRVCRPCVAQQDTGTILGTVEDTSGSIIHGATVTVENQGTANVLSLKTDSSGVFIAPEIPIGIYRVSASST